MTSVEAFEHMVSKTRHDIVCRRYSTEGDCTCGLAGQVERVRKELADAQKQRDDARLGIVKVPVTQTALLPKEKPAPTTVPRALVTLPEARVGKQQVSPFWICFWGAFVGNGLLEIVRFFL